MNGSKEQKNKGNVPTTIIGILTILAYTGYEFLLNIPEGGEFNLKTLLLTLVGAAFLILKKNWSFIIPNKDSIKVLLIFILPALFYNCSGLSQGLNPSFVDNVGIYELKDVVVTYYKLCRDAELIAEDKADYIKIATESFMSTYIAIEGSASIQLEIENLSSNEVVELVDLEILFLELKYRGIYRVVCEVTLKSIQAKSSDYYIRSEL